MKMMNSVMEIELPASSYKEKSELSIIYSLNVSCWTIAEEFTEQMRQKTFHHDTFSHQLNPQLLYSNMD